MPHADAINLHHLHAILAQARLTPAHAAGQNFLVCEAVRAATLTALPHPSYPVTELGAGLGTLTQALVRSGFTVRAIERDLALIPLLRQQVVPELQKQLTIVPGDVRSTDWRWSTPYYVVGNIPYNLSGLILRRITQLDPAPARAIVLVQQEVGERVRAVPPAMHLVSVAMQLWGIPTRLRKVPASCFWPQPQVDSELLQLTPHAKRLSVEQREQIVAVAKHCFQQRRKQIGGVLQHRWHLSRHEVERRLADIALRATQRPQELSVADWQRLTEAFLPTP